MKHVQEVEQINGGSSSEGPSGHAESLNIINTNNSNTT